MHVVYFHHLHHDAFVVHSSAVEVVVAVVNKVVDHEHNAGCVQEAYGQGEAFPFLPWW